MAHVPHLHLPRPWESGELELDPQHHHHLFEVLRRRPGDPVTYTDGEGTLGTGHLRSDSVGRGEERVVVRPPGLIAVAVAPPRSAQRVRFVVEKLAELGTDRLIWISARQGEGRAPRPEKATAWARAALEQSRGAFLMQISGPLEVGAIEGEQVWIFQEGGVVAPVLSGGAEVVGLVGPEGGFAEDEIPSTATRVSLGRRILRVETAAVAASVIMADRLGRLAPSDQVPTT